MCEPLTLHVKLNLILTPPSYHLYLGTGRHPPRPRTSPRTRRLSPPRPRLLWPPHLSQQLLGNRSRSPLRGRGRALLLLLGLRGGLLLIICYVPLIFIFYVRTSHIACEVESNPHSTLLSFIPRDWASSTAPSDKPSDAPTFAPTAAPSLAPTPFPTTPGQSQPVSAPWAWAGAASASGSSW